MNYKAACPLHVGIHETWNGGVAFMHDDEELLYVGLHPEQRKFAVRYPLFRASSTSSSEPSIYIMHYFKGCFIVLHFQVGTQA